MTQVSLALGTGNLVRVLPSSCQPPSNILFRDRAQKLGHPVSESNFVSELNKGIVAADTAIESFVMYVVLAAERLSCPPAA